MSNFPHNSSNFLKQLFTKKKNNKKLVKDEQRLSKKKILLNYYSSLVMYHPDLILIFSPEGEILFQNKNRIIAFIGYSLRKKRDFKKFIPKESYTLLNDSFKNTLKGKSEEHEITIKNKHNQTVFAALTFIPIKNTDGEVEGVYLIIKDITKHKQLENQLQTTNKNLNHIFDHLNGGIWMRESVDGKIKYASKGLEKILQIPLNELYADPDVWKEMILPAHRDDVLNKYKLLQEGERIQIKFRINDRDGTTKWVLEQTIPRMNDKGEVIDLFGMVTDISSEVEMHDQLKFLATYNSLTALPNQQSLYEKLDTLCKNSSNQFAVLYLDLDRFHVINDSLGYQVGNDVLKTVANRLISTVTESAYVAHINGNDFVFIIENFSNKESIFTLAEKIITSIGKKLTVKEYEFYITTSIGISFFPEDGNNKLTLLERAHSALYHAKQQGKNNYQLYSFSRDISSYKKYILEQGMRQAIMNEEFELYYQPIVDSNNGIIKGAEALIRWNHEEWGVVSPEEFIPLAEENHLIHQISDWVIGKVCEHLRKWKDNDYTLRPISINLSPIRFFKKGLVDLVKEQLEIHQTSAKYLWFEITEGSLLKSEEKVLSTIDALKDLGVNIVIDDFGTGYASLKYLREFPADAIKIDQIFIRSSDGQNDIDQAIVSSVLFLAKELNIKIVAEGVEECEQLEFLKQKECDLIQGYLFSKPVQLNIFEKMMQTGYLKPKKHKRKSIPNKERRKFYRFEFPHNVHGELAILEVNNRKVDLGFAKMLIENISLGGMKIITPLRLPINANMKFEFHFTLMDEPFEIEGALVWQNEGKGSTFYYGIKFDIKYSDEDRLVAVINKMTVMRNLNQKIPGTDFVYEEPNLYFT